MSRADMVETLRTAAHDAELSHLLHRWVVTPESTTEWKQPIRFKNRALTALTQCAIGMTRGPFTYSVFRAAHPSSVFLTLA